MFKFISTIFNSIILFISNIINTVLTFLDIQNTIIIMSTIFIIMYIIQINHITNKVKTNQIKSKEDFIKNIIPLFPFLPFVWISNGYILLFNIVSTFLHKISMSIKVFNSFNEDL